MRVIQNNTLTTVEAVRIENNGTHFNAHCLMAVKNSGSTGDVIYVVNSGTGAGIDISNNGTGQSININNHSGIGINIVNTGTSDSLRIADENSDTTLLRVDASGRVGIGVGTSTITDKFIVNAGNTVLAIQEDRDIYNVVGAALNTVRLEWSVVS